MLLIFVVFNACPHPLKIGDDFFLNFCPYKMAPVYPVSSGLRHGVFIALQSLDAPSDAALQRWAKIEEKAATRAGTRLRNV